MAEEVTNQEGDREGQSPVMFNELGKTGLSRFGGEIQEEEIRELRGDKSIEQFKEMRDNDAMVGALLFVIKNLIRQADWEIIEGQEEDREFVRQNLKDMEHAWDETLSSILSFLPFGFSVFEIVWKKREGETSSDDKPDSDFNDGRIGWHKFAPRAQETIEWEFDDSGNLEKIIQDLSKAGVQGGFTRRQLEIPKEKVLLFRTEIGKDNPTGRSILRSAWRSWYFKKNIEELEGIGIERDLAGIPVAWVPENIANPDTSEEKTAKSDWEDMVVNIRNDEQMGLVLPLAYTEGGEKKYDFELLSSGGDQQIDTGEVINRYDTRILQTVMADFIMLGTTATGSFALSKSKTELFSLAISTYLDIIEDRMNEKAIPKLFKVNGMGDRELPKIKHGKVKPPSLDELGNFIAKLASAGARPFPNEQLTNKLLEMAGLNVDEAEQTEVNPQDIDVVDNPDATQRGLDPEDLQQQVAQQVLGDIMPEINPDIEPDSNQQDN